MKNQNFLLFCARAAAFSSKHNPAFAYSFSLPARAITTINTAANADIYSYNRTINDLMQSGFLDSAVKMFDEMTERDIITWNIMISGHYRRGFLKESLNLYSQMVCRGFVENSSTFSTVLSMCTSAWLFREGREVHCKAAVLGLSEMGRAKELLRMYNEMKLEGLEPNGLTFCYLVQGCGYERCLDEGMQLHCVIKRGLVDSNFGQCICGIRNRQLVHSWDS